MGWVVLALLVTLSAPFGEATATVVDADAELAVECSVEVDGPAVAVLIRAIGRGGEAAPVAMVAAEDGRWVGVLELPVVENVRVGFEAIRPDGKVELSEVRTLVELGVPGAVFVGSGPPETPTTTAGDPRFSAESNRWGWFALATGAAGLALLAWWARGARTAPPSEEGIDNRSVEPDHSVDAGREVTPPG